MFKNSCHTWTLRIVIDFGNIVGIFEYMLIWGLEPYKMSRM